MVTYRPIKKWLLPLICIVTGVAVGFSLFPSKQDRTYSDWMNHLKSNEESTFNLQGIYEWEDNVYANSKGIWTENKSFLKITTSISSGDDFIFDAYLFENEFYINSADQWFTGDLPHNFTNELVPLENPFKWTAELLQYADQIKTSNDKNSITYIASFKQFPEIDFRGTLLSEQINTSLQMTFQNGEVKSLVFKANPKRPSKVGPLRSYPKKISYELTFEASLDKVPTLPKESADAESID